MWVGKAASACWKRKLGEFYLQGACYPRESLFPSSTHQMGWPCVVNPHVLQQAPQQAGSLRWEVIRSPAKPLSLEEVQGSEHPWGKSKAMSNSGALTLLRILKFGVARPGPSAFLGLEELFCSLPGLTPERDSPSCVMSGS